MREQRGPMQWGVRDRNVVKGAVDGVHLAVFRKEKIERMEWRAFIARSVQGRRRGLLPIKKKKRKNKKKSFYFL